jgi:hypothetical protein
MICSQEIKGFLYDLIQSPPKSIVVIEEGSDYVHEACSELKCDPLTIDFKTFVKENDPSMHAHLFTPLNQPEEVIIGEKKKNMKVETTNFNGQMQV